MHLAKRRPTRLTAEHTAPVIVIHEAACSRVIKADSRQLKYAGDFGIFGERTSGTGMGQPFASVTLFGWCKQLFTSRHGSPMQHSFIDHRTLEVATKLFLQMPRLGVLPEKILPHVFRPEGCDLQRENWVRGIFHR